MTQLMTTTHVNPIQKKLNNVLDEIRDIYGEENIFAIFTLDNGKTYICAIIPTFEDIVINNPLIYEKPIDDNIICIDIRYAYHATKDGIPSLIGGLYTDDRVINPRYEHIFNNLFLKNRDKIKEAILVGIPAEELKIALSKLLRCALNDNSNTVIFIKQLTDAEKLALEALISLSGDEGIISLYKVAEMSGVSQKTVSKLILKMELNHIAKIESRGLKGTYIKILEDTLLSTGINPA